MLLSPRYDDPGFVTLDLPVGDVGASLVGQRRRLADLLATLTDGQWRAQSRCDDWNVRDVVTHLHSTNQFWAMSLAAGAAGEPTRFLASFDPVASPAALVDAAGDVSPEVTLADFRASTEALATVVGGLDAAAWDMPGEAPPGHISLRLVAMHALWDAWIHERDIAVPLGLTPTVVDDEVVASLVYATALSPAFAADADPGATGAVAVTATDPATAFVVEVADGVTIRGGDAPTGAAALTGDAVTLLEDLSHRGTFPPVAEEHQWLFRGLATVFDHEA